MWRLSLYMFFLGRRLPELGGRWYVHRPLSSWLMVAAKFVWRPCVGRPGCLVASQWLPRPFGGLALIAKTVLCGHCVCCQQLPSWSVNSNDFLIFFFPVILGITLQFFKLLNKFSFVDPAYNTFFKCSPHQSNSQFYTFQNPKHFTKLYQSNPFLNFQSSFFPKCNILGVYCQLSD